MQNPIPKNNPQNQFGVVDVDQLIYKSKISLALNSYDDIFSDFDPRPYSDRALSQDFLEEAKRAAIENTHNLELELMVKKGMRKPSSEAMIKRRLHEHFKKHHELLAKDSDKAVTDGVWIALVGFTLMLIATTMAFYELQKSFLVTFITVILEPSGWFAVWVGLDKVFYGRNQNKSEREFYQKMASSHITFITY